ncbi:MAG: ATP-binding protein [Ignisphaera sp.]|nr:ATP-binding protein [Ignisphaera sp.]MCX8167734.1 ATP-binding protein [Ignisphaera sp.]MDW8085298.1 ATP-binding protein [Ignisphaera sp.]
MSVLQTGNGKILNLQLEVVGYVVGESKPYRADIIAFRPLAIGEYLYMEYYDYRALAMVGTSITGSPVITDDLTDPKDIERLIKTVRYGERMYYYRGSIKILGSIDGSSSKLYIPPIPPPPGTEVLKAPKSVLARVFSQDGRNYVRVGTLLRELDVEVRVNINKIVSRHLGILAMTGMGKSNLVALIAKKIAEIGGTTIIFDYHGEYSSMRLQNIVTNVVKPKINPLSLDLEGMSRLLNIPKNATRQRMALRECLENIGESDFFTKLKKCLQGRVGRYGTSAQKVLDSVTVYEGFLRRILDEKIEDVVNTIVLGAINIVDLSDIHLNQADAVVSYWLDRILEARKIGVWSRGSRGIPSPLTLVIEEAHAFIPADIETATKKSAESIVREGRKFGVGLIIVSQRPRGLDPTVLSQLGNLAVLRIVHPEDQQYVARHCEPITQDIVEELPGLNTGEAMLLGEWVSVPTIVKIDLVKEKLSGGDVDAVAHWNRLYSARTESLGM